MTTMTTTTKYPRDLRSAKNRTDTLRVWRESGERATPHLMAQRDQDVCYVLVGRDEQRCVYDCSGRLASSRVIGRR
jgi:hypothetical protein